MTEELPMENNTTELEKALKNMKQMQTQLLQSEKMASIGELAAGVAHEINNPVGFVKSNLGTMEEYRKDLTTLLQSYAELESALAGSSRAKQISTVQAAVRNISQVKEDIDIDYIMDDYPVLIEESVEGMARVAKIVDDLKDFAHPGKVRAEFSDINQGVLSTLNVVWNELKYKAVVRKDLGDLPLVRCYPQQLNQVFANLLVNAAHAVEKDGEIRIRTEAEGERVVIRVSDNGCGIPREIIPKIYDPFFTTKEVGKGTGLGLNMVYNIIQTHKGTIDVESQVGKGTTFTIVLAVDPELD